MDNSLPGYSRYVFVGRCVGPLGMRTTGYKPLNRSRGRLIWPRNPLPLKLTEVPLLLSYVSLSTFVWVGSAL